VEKLVYLLWRERGDSAGAFAKRLLERAGRELAARGAREVVLHVADADADLAQTVPVRDERDLFAATASFWLANVDDAPRFAEALASASARLAGYLVTESVPRDFDARPAKMGVRSPGLVMISAFPQPPWLERDEFIARWHGSHTPLALEVHPLWRYVRNVVARALTPGAPELAGIVEEHVREERDLVDPARFYGGAEHAAANMQRILDDAKRFLELERVASVVTSQYILS
jgi:hypothetical protein